MIFFNDEDIVQQIENHGIKKGIEMGMRKGFKEGKKEGIIEGKKEGIKEGIEKGIKKANEETAVKRILIGYIKGRKKVDDKTKMILKEMNDDYLVNVAKGLLPILSLDDFSDSDEIDEEERESRERKLMEIKEEDYDILEEVINPMLI